MADISFFGYSAPFVSRSGEILPFQSGIRIIQNDLLLSILTLKGRVPHRPNFGTNLRRVVFDQIDTATINSIREEIIQVVEADGRVVINNIFVNKKEDDRLQVSKAQSDALTLDIRLELALIDEPDVTFLVEL